jgi:hypothetical protein
MLGLDEWQQDVLAGDDYHHSISWTPTELPRQHPRQWYAEVHGGDGQMMRDPRTFRVHASRWTPAPYTRMYISEIKRASRLPHCLVSEVMDFLGPFVGDHASSPRKLMTCQWEFRELVPHAYHTAEHVEVTVWSGVFAPLDTNPWLAAVYGCRESIARTVVEIRRATTHSHPLLLARTCKIPFEAANSSWWHHPFVGRWTLDARGERLTTRSAGRKHSDRVYEAERSGRASRLEYVRKSFERVSARRDLFAHWEV